MEENRFAGRAASSGFDALERMILERVQAFVQELLEEELPAEPPAPLDPELSPKSRSEPAHAHRKELAVKAKEIDRIRSFLNVLDPFDNR